MSKKPERDLQGMIEKSVVDGFYNDPEGCEGTEKLGYAHMHAVEIVRRLIRTDSVRIIPAIGPNRLKAYVDSYGADMLDELDVEIGSPISPTTAELSHFDFGSYNREIRANDHDTQRNLANFVGGFEEFLDIITEEKIKRIAPKPPKQDITKQR
jgi:hypothetical protein